MLASQWELQSPNLSILEHPRLLLAARFTLARGLLPLEMQAAVGSLVARPTSQKIGQDLRDLELVCSLEAPRPLVAARPKLLACPLECL